MHRHRLFSSCFLLLGFVFCLTVHGTPLPQESQLFFNILHYETEFAVDPFLEMGAVASDTQLRLQTTQATQTLHLHIGDLQVQKLKVQRPLVTQIRHEVKEGVLSITLPQVLRKGELVYLSMRLLVPLHRSEQKGLFEVKGKDSKKWGPLLGLNLNNHPESFLPILSKDQNRATFKISCYVPASYEVLGSGNLVESKTFQKKSLLWKKVTWESPSPLPLASIGLAIVPFKPVKKTLPGIELALWAKPGLRPALDFKQAVLEQGLDFLNEKFKVRYPWSALHVVYFPKLKQPSLQSAGLVLLSEEQFGGPVLESQKENLALHTAEELLNQWFQTLVSFDSPLEQPHAQGLKRTLMLSMMEELYQANTYLLNEQTDFHIRTLNQRAQGKHIERTAIERAYNGFFTLSRHLGEVTFFRSLKDFFERNRFQTVTLATLFESIKRISRQDLEKGYRASALEVHPQTLEWKGQWLDEKKKYLIESSLSQTAHLPLPISLFTLLPPQSHSPPLSFAKDSLSHFIDLKEAPSLALLGQHWEAFIEFEQKDLGENTLTPSLYLQIPPSLRLSLLARQIAMGPQGFALLLSLLEAEKNPHVRRNALRLLYQTQHSRWFDPSLNPRLTQWFKEVVQTAFETSKEYQKQPHAWSLYKLEVITMMGKVRSDEVLTLLQKELLKKNVETDVLEKLSQAVSEQGGGLALNLLRRKYGSLPATNETPRKIVELALVRWESKEARMEVEKLVQKYREDSFLYKVAVQAALNQTLVRSKEWTDFLYRLCVGEPHLSESLKISFLHTLKNSTNPHAIKMLGQIEKKAPSPALVEETRNLMDAMEDRAEMKVQEKKPAEGNQSAPLTLG